MKTLEDEWYAVIKYKFTVFEILRVCFVLSYVVWRLNCQGGNIKQTTIDIVTTTGAYQW